MIFELGDRLKTTKGIMFVQCTFEFKGILENNPLYWLIDSTGNDLILTKKELKTIFITVY